MKTKRASGFESGSPPDSAPIVGSQTLWRGLNLLETVAAGPATLSELTRRLSLNRSTVHRLASALVERGYLQLVIGEGYMLGSKLLALGDAARGQLDLPRVARPFLEKLSEITGDAVHLGVLDHNKALYLDKLQGRRRITIGSRVGERHPLCSTGLGKALLLDCTPDELRMYYRSEANLRPKGASNISRWLEKMASYAAGGYTFDMEENEDRIRCVGAPIRDHSGSIIAAISVSSVAQYMTERRMTELISIVRQTADAISGKLGWRDS